MQNYERVTREGSKFDNATIQGSKSAFTTDCLKLSQLILSSSLLAFCLALFIVFVVAFIIILFFTSCFVYNCLKQLLARYISFVSIGQHPFLIILTQTLMTVLDSHARMVEIVQMK